MRRSQRERRGRSRWPCARAVAQESRNQSRFAALWLFALGKLRKRGDVRERLHTQQPRIDWLAGLMTGYGNRPYSGGRFFVRMLYRF
jgi:hypothetical protein